MCINISNKENFLLPPDSAGKKTTRFTKHLPTAGSPLFNASLQENRITLPRTKTYTNLTSFLPQRSDRATTASPEEIKALLRELDSLNKASNCLASLNETFLKIKKPNVT